MTGARRNWQFWRQRGAWAVLVGGFALAASQLLNHMPREQELLFKVPSPLAVRTLKASWSNLEGDEIGGVNLHFPAGRKRTIRHQVELANGIYDVHVELDFLANQSSNVQPRPETNLRRRVTLRGGETPISL